MRLVVSLLLLLVLPLLDAKPVWSFLTSRLVLGGASSDNSTHNLFRLI